MTTLQRTLPIDREEAFGWFFLFRTKNIKNKSQMRLVMEDSDYQYKESLNHLGTYNMLW